MKNVKIVRGEHAGTSGTLTGALWGANTAIVKTEAGEEIAVKLTDTERIQRSSCEMTRRCVDVLIPLMRRNRITADDIEAEIDYRESHKDKLIDCENDDLRFFSTEELISCKRLWKEC